MILGRHPTAPFSLTRCSSLVKRVAANGYRKFAGLLLSSKPWTWRLLHKPADMQVSLLIHVLAIVTTSRDFASLMNEANPLGKLPTELLQQIIDYLNFLTRVKLSTVNKHLSIITCPEKCNQHDKRAALLSAESFPQNANAFGCFRCFKVLPASAFDDWRIGIDYPWSDRPLYATSYHNRKGGRDSHRRHCLDCSFRLQLHTAGEIMYLQGVRMVVCIQCGNLKAWPVCPDCRICGECLHSFCVGCGFCGACLLRKRHRLRLGEFCSKRCKDAVEHRPQSAEPVGVSWQPLPMRSRGDSSFE